jgi:hypothetical protein
MVVQAIFLDEGENNTYESDTRLEKRSERGFSTRLSKNVEILNPSPLLPPYADKLY